MEIRQFKGQIDEKEQQNLDEKKRLREINARYRKTILKEESEKENASKIEELSKEMFEVSRNYENELEEYLKKLEDIESPDDLLQEIDIQLQNSLFLLEIGSESKYFDNQSN